MQQTIGKNEKITRKGIKFNQNSQRFVIPPETVSIEKQDSSRDDHLLNKSLQRSLRNKNITK